MLTSLSRSIYNSKYKLLFFLAPLGLGFILSTVSITKFLARNRAAPRETPLEIRSLVDLEKKYKNYDGSKLRYLAFTAAPFSYDSYPFLVSNDIKNVAIKSINLGTASTCTRSLVGDAAYDVIFIEYYFDHKKLTTLAQRLRQRFPDAAIIFTRFWTPKLMSYAEMDTGKTKYFTEWLQAHALSGNSHDTIAAFEKSDINWSLQSLPGLDHIQDQVVEKVNGHLFKGPGADWDKIGDVRDMFKAELFDDHFNSFSKQGHRVVAEEIKKYLSTIKPQRSVNLGTWDEDKEESCAAEAAKNSLRSELPNVRYLKLGTFTSQVSYAHLLSSDITMIDASAEQASLCPQSLIGDKVYDVILIEYFLSSAGLNVLAARLRQRFPEATFVFTRFLQPKMLFFNDKITGKKTYFTEWLKGIGMHRKSPEAIAAFEASGEDWALRDPLISDRSETQYEAIMEVNGYLYQGPGSAWDIALDTKSMFLQISDLYDEQYQLSAQGNKAVAQEIQKLLQDIKPKRSDIVAKWSEDESCSGV